MFDINLSTVAHQGHGLIWVFDFDVSSWGMICKGCDSPIVLFYYLYYISNWVAQQTATCGQVSANWWRKNERVDSVLRSFTTPPLSLASPTIAYQGHGLIS